MEDTKERASCISRLQKEIVVLKQELECLLITEPMNSQNVLEASKRLDIRISCFYKLKGA